MILHAVAWWCCWHSALSAMRNWGNLGLRIKRMRLATNASSVDATGGQTMGPIAQCRPAGQPPHIYFQGDFERLSGLNLFHIESAIVRVAGPSGISQQSFLTLLLGNEAADRLTCR